MRSFPLVPEFWDDDRRDEILRLTAQAVNGAIQGETNNLLTVTLSAGATSTEVPDPRIDVQKMGFLQPTSATAAAAMAAGAVWLEAKKGSFTVHHDNTADTDRTFAVLFGG